MPTWLFYKTDSKRVFSPLLKSPYLAKILQDTDFSRNPQSNPAGTLPRADLPYIHITTAKHLLSQPEPVNLTVWKSNGSIVEYPSVISISYDFYKGTRHIKFLRSGEIRLVRYVCIYRLNGMQVIL